jgi:hypothetical protein
LLVIKPQGGIRITKYLYTKGKVQELTTEKIGMFIMDYYTGKVLPYYKNQVLDPSSSKLND